MRRWLVVGWMMAGIILFAGKTATEEILPADSAAEIPAPRYVALTFDDGPRPGSTERLLEGLRDRGAVRRSSSLVSRHRCIPSWYR